MHCTMDVTSRRAGSCHVLPGGRRPATVVLGQHNRTRGSTRARAMHASATETLREHCISVVNPEGGAAFEVTLQVPVGAEVYQVALKKPLGLTLTEADSCIVVDELRPGGHAEKAGVLPGDRLLALTARAQVSSTSAPQLVVMQAQGQAFKAVAAGLRSNTCSQCSIALVLCRQQH